MMLLYRTLEAYDAPDVASIMLSRITDWGAVSPSSIPSAPTRHSADGTSLVMSSPYVVLNIRDTLTGDSRQLRDRGSFSSLCNDLGPDVWNKLRVLTRTRYLTLSSMHARTMLRAPYKGSPFVRLGFKWLLLLHQNSYLAFTHYEKFLFSLNMNEQGEFTAPVLLAINLSRTFLFKMHQNSPVPVQSYAGLSRNMLMTLFVCLGIFRS